jgi:hypothetical protein
MADSGECDIQVLQLHLGERRGWGVCIRFERGRGASRGGSSARAEEGAWVMRHGGTWLAASSGFGRQEVEDRPKWAADGGPLVGPNGGVGEHVRLCRHS